MKRDPDFQPLLKAVQARFGRAISASSECSELSIHIYTCIHLSISDQTLRRFFGFISDGVIPSKNSVSILLQYCGYTSISELLNDKVVAGIPMPESGGTRLIKEFYNIKLSPGVDFNYQKACGNIARQLLQEPALLNSLSGFLSRSKVAQIYFFERHPYIDGLCNGYEKLIRLYAQEKKTPKAQLFSACLLHLGSVLSDNQAEATKHIQRIRQITFDNSLHPFIQARRIMAFLTQAWIEDNKQELINWTDISFNEEAKQPRNPSGQAYFPFFQFILADAFNLIGDYKSALEMIKIAFKDYKREDDAIIEDGYFECLDLVKAIALYHTGHHTEAVELLRNIENSGFIFIMHDYCLIQRKLLELEACSPESSLKRPTILKDLKRLILKSGFTIFNRKLQEVM
jgi:tetratricopeptide (TPR) repeat protein